MLTSNKDLYVHDADVAKQRNSQQAVPVHSSKKSKETELKPSKQAHFSNFGYKQTKAGQLDRERAHVTMATKQRDASNHSFKAALEIIVINK